MHAQNNRKALVGFQLETAYLILGDVAEDIIKGNEIDPVYNLRLETDIEWICILDFAPGQVLKLFSMLYLRVAVTHVGTELMIADRCDKLLSEVFFDKIEIGFALPVDQIPGVDNIFDMLLRPGQSIP